ncbi:MAG: sulfite exporter TauE/SafE family protein [Endomicrobia bacterium]|nr:sulfite exporter TauE/SafE family protein [Endomicrobiia bacterium]
MLKIIIIIFLIIVGIKFLLKPIFKWQHSQLFLTFWQQNLAAVISGTVIGIISGIFGVAGGEFRIPVLIYLFGMDIKLAGTASLLVSIPTVATGFLKHHHLNHFDKQYALVVMLMSVGSLIGSYLGAKTVYFLHKEILEILLGSILILATVRMWTKP